MTDPRPIKSPKSTATEPVTAAPAPSVAPASTTAPDEHHGHGGMYTVINGQRVLVERTLGEHVAPAAETTQPATPVNPATTE